MNDILDQYLCKKYPKIFKERKLSVRESCMGRGFECGDGWFTLINSLCFRIQDYIDQHNKYLQKGEKKIPQFVALQVKEKFGCLRIYYKGGDDVCRGLVTMAESFSYYLCENCGTTQNVGRTTGWIQSLCEDCAKEYGKTITQDKERVKLMEKVVKSRHNPKRSWKSFDELTIADLK